MKQSCNAQSLGSSAWEPSSRVLIWGCVVTSTVPSWEQRAARSKLRFPSSPVDIWLSSVSCVPSRRHEEHEIQSLPLANSGGHPAPLLQLSNSFRHQEMVSVPERDVSTKEGNHRGGSGGT